MYWRMSGTSVKIASRPRITLGTAASSSTRNVQALESLGGASSARKMAAPTPSGTEISRARKDVSTVP